MKIPFGRPTIGDEEKQAVLEVLGGDILTHGPQNKAFEKEFTEWMGGSVTALATSSCMGALHLAYWQLGLGVGDEVIVPAQTHTATVHAVELVGATPVFVDCELATGNLTPAAIEAAITPRTKAIAVVHFLGIACEMPAIMRLAERHGLKVVEDCALAIGTRIDGRHVGTFGDVGTFSFYPAKHITTAEGGMFVTRHADLAARVAKVRGFGVDRDFSERKIPGIYDVTMLGLNYRMSDLNAAIGRVQVRRIPEILSRRAANFARLKARLLADVEGLTVLDAIHPHTTNSHYCLTVVLPPALRSRRNEFIPLLNEAGIGTSVYYPQPVPRMTYYRNKYGYEASRYPNAEAISDGSIALPVGPHVTESDVDFIAQTFKAIITPNQIG